MTGADLLPQFRRAAPLDLFGTGTGGLGGIDALPQPDLHTETAWRRVYVHPFRWTSLGLALIDAIDLDMPIVALAATEAPEAVPHAAGAVSKDVEHLCDDVRALISDREEAREHGRRARVAALKRYSLERFIRDWDELLAELTDVRPQPRPSDSNAS